jgi:hypothetical protein
MRSVWQCLNIRMEMSCIYIYSATHSCHEQERLVPAIAVRANQNSPTLGAGDA